MQAAAALQDFYTGTSAFLAGCPCILSRLHSNPLSAPRSAAALHPPALRMLRRLRCPPLPPSSRIFNPISYPSKHDPNSRAAQFRTLPITPSHICLSPRLCTPARYIASAPGRGPPTNLSSLKIKVVAIFTICSSIPLPIYCTRTFNIHRFFLISEYPPPPPRQSTPSSAPRSTSQSAARSSG
jgi:hypothetical protein